MVNRRVARTKPRTMQLTETRDDQQAANRSDPMRRVPYA